MFLVASQQLPIDAVQSRQGTQARQEMRSLAVSCRRSTVYSEPILLLLGEMFDPSAKDESISKNASLPMICPLQCSFLDFHSRTSFLSTFFQNHSNHSSQLVMVPFFFSPHGPYILGLMMPQITFWFSPPVEATVGLVLHSNIWWPYYSPISSPLSI